MEKCDSSFCLLMLKELESSFCLTVSREVEFCVDCPNVGPELTKEEIVGTTFPEGELDCVGREFSVVLCTYSVEE